MPAPSSSASGGRLRPTSRTARVQRSRLPDARAARDADALSAAVEVAEEISARLGTAAADLKQRLDATEALFSDV